MMRDDELKDLTVKVLGLDPADIFGLITAWVQGRPDLPEADFDAVARTALVFMARHWPECQYASLVGHIAEGVSGPVLPILPRTFSAQTSPARPGLD